MLCTVNTEWAFSTSCNTVSVNQALEILMYRTYLLN